ncbi:nucleotidyltransferase family protein [Cellulomonas endometrii]|uniref:nucleotidyltransferase family protein n=1 Tax=Cellulomonas endometrii TaxID=3036301 RepID=UPI0024ACD879|nr:nucleotidyltransferase domain-containing protein [Cellulomonas endometrii]
MTDEGFLDRLADPLAALPGVRAVTLGGSRAQGTARPDSDWDVAVYYRGSFQPQRLRDLGWPGEVSEVGGWGGGVFNGGAWLEVEGRRVDVHYRDLDVVEREVARARRGEVAVEPLMFHLAGIPTYLVVAELATHRVLRGEPPVVDAYPEALRRAAPPVWQGRAEAHLAYARDTHARHGRVTPCLGLLAVAASEYAHAVVAARGEWVTNDKRLLTAAGLGPVDAVVAGAGTAPGALADAVDAVRDLGRAALGGAVAPGPDRA